ncbi:hypothetical protein LCGC14_2739020, partial [marine sediment metagenome]
YCFYKTMKVIPELFRALKENNKARKELAEFLNNQKPFAEVLSLRNHANGRISEDGVDEQKGFKVSVPEERPEVTISFNTEVTEVPIEPPVTPPVEPPVVEPPVVTPPVIEPPVIIPPIVPLVEPESKVFEALIGLLAIILAALGVKWRAGFLGMAKWQWNKGNKLTAIKMLLTATKRAKEDYYKKKG